MEPALSLHVWLWSKRARFVLGRSLKSLEGCVRKSIWCNIMWIREWIKLAFFKQYSTAHSISISGGNTLICMCGHMWVPHIESGHIVGMLSLPTVIRPLPTIGWREMRVNVAANLHAFLYVKKASIKMGLLQLLNLSTILELSHSISGTTCSLWL